jgi:hypothetical protein
VTDRVNSGYLVTGVLGYSVKRLTECRIGSMKAVLRAESAYKGTPTGVRRIRSGVGGSLYVLALVVK